MGEGVGEKKRSLTDVLEEILKDEASEDSEVSEEGESEEDVEFPETGIAGQGFFPEQAVAEELEESSVGDIGDVVLIDPDEVDELNRLEEIVPEKSEKDEGPVEYVAGVEKGPDYIESDKGNFESYEPREEKRDIVYLEGNAPLMRREEEERPVYDDSKHTKEVSVSEVGFLDTLERKEGDFLKPRHEKEKGYEEPKRW
ncbi:hypothetical protein D6829_02340 [Candidatus Pacearchaeota archaeon]|nr:MAG: hypothetical protein D6829_02340 [Candidatus Pacearchaeota archaeon]